MGWQGKILRVECGFFRHGRIGLHRSLLSFIILLALHPEHHNQK